MEIYFIEDEGLIRLTYYNKLSIEDLSDNAFYLTQFLPPVDEVSIVSSVGKDGIQIIEIKGKACFTKNDAIKLSIMTGKELKVESSVKKHKKNRRKFIYTL